MELISVVIANRVSKYRPARAGPTRLFAGPVSIYAADQALYLQ